MVSSFLTSVLLGASAAAVHAHSFHDHTIEKRDLGKSSWTSTMYGTIDTTMSQDLATAGGHTIVQWPAGTMPQSCQDHVNEDPPNRCPLDQVEVYDVHYNDCSEPWVWCRCSNAPDDMEDAVTGFGHVPIGLRSSVRHVMLFGEQPTPLAGLTTGQDVMLFGNVSSETTVYVPTHESAHAFDEAVNFNLSNGLTAPLAQDSCVVTDYANTDTAEDWAELVVAAVYEYREGAGSLGSAAIDHGDESCFQNQFAYVQANAPQSVLYPDGMQCDLSRKPPATANVTISSKKVRRGGEGFFAKLFKA